eukprot:TRINITY_DN131_c1_g1_i1.p1 TRINITY_DN131_c1_g1~~TRINITY_DN131_c1_g1_i1.p1  ORF type:complete len:805 (-),score=209.56 TRINITY_DN131_c1_g1_i1:66-2426(-)
MAGRQSVARCVSVGVLSECHTFKNRFMKAFSCQPEFSCGAYGGATQVSKVVRQLPVGGEDWTVVLYDASAADGCQLFSLFEGVIFMYAAASRKSFDAIRAFHASVVEHTAPTPPLFQLLGIAGDASLRAVPEEDVQAKAAQLRCQFTEISSELLTTEIDSVVAFFVREIIKTCASSMAIQKAAAIDVPTGPSQAGGGGILTSNKLHTLSQRGKVAFEVLTTERSYCSVMQETVDFFLVPLRNGECPFFDLRYITPIFFNLEQILESNLKFLHDMEYHFYSLDFSDKEPMIMMFKNLLPALDLYSDYVKNQWEAILTVTKKCQHPAVVAFFQHSKDSTESKLDLLSRLIEPVQRACRYKLLLADLVKHTDADHPDCASLQLLLSHVSDIAFRINEDMHKQDNFKQCLHIQNCFVGKISDIANRDREIIREGPLWKSVRSGKHKKRWFFLFNDCLVYATPTQIPGLTYEMHNGYSFTSPMVLTSFNADDGVPPGIMGSEKAFRVTSNQKSFIVLTDSEAEKADWIKAINTSSHANTGNHAPLWIADTATNACLLCNRQFSLTFRRHHCRNCGIIVCGYCSTSKTKLSRLAADADPVRVCDECTKTLAEGGRASPQQQQQQQQGSVSGVFKKILTVANEKRLTYYPPQRTSQRSPPMARRESLRSFSPQQQNISQQIPHYPPPDPLPRRSVLLEEEAFSFGRQSAPVPDYHEEQMAVAEAAAASAPLPVEWEEEATELATEAPVAQWRESREYRMRRGYSAIFHADYLRRSPHSRSRSAPPRPLRPLAL